MIQAKHKTGLVFFPAFDWAISPTHPEREERLLYTQDQVFEEGLLDIDGIIEFKPDLVSIKEVERVHFCIPNPETVMTESHFISAGGAKTIGKQVMKKSVDKGFALVRPPGHHANRVVHGARGFCNVNIEAIMIEYLRREYHIKKVAIVDTDCHHGDGTQDIYWNDPNTLFISIHQDGRTLYPGSGFLSEMGGPNAFGLTVNIPLPPYTSDEGFIYALNHAVMPIIEDFEPEIIINSAGQDNHYSDPITNMNFSARGYARLTSILNPDIAILEGGYSIEGALPYVNTGIILALAGLEYDYLKEPDYNPDQIRQNEETTRWIQQICDKVMENWNHRHYIRIKKYESEGIFIRNRKIFYDTDSIHEHQRESIRICSDCGGVYSLDSESDRGYHILAVHIPINACDKCQHLGQEWYQSANNNQYDFIYLQDRTTDTFHKF